MNYTVNVEKLVAAGEVSNVAVQAAMKKRQEQKLAEEVARAERVIKLVDATINNYVGTIRNARAAEKEAKAKVKQIEAAMKAYLAGDASKLAELGIR